jgi:ABC-2 type transport system ATP-binding protein
VLRDVSFEIAEGRIVGLLGPSGAGKSTIMRAIVGVQANVSGAIAVLGERPGASSLLTSVAYSTQQSSVFDDLSVAQNLAFSARILNVPKHRVADVIAHVGLTDVASKRAADLSGGQRSRVSLAIALLGSPRIIVLDEPTVGLDPVLRAELWGLFRALADAGTTLLVSSHVMDEAERCDDIMFVRDGAVIAFDTLPNILSTTATDSAEGAFLELARRSS